MPDLGPYGGAVYGAYALSLALIGGLVIWVAWRAGAVKRALARAEARNAGGTHG